MLLRTIAGALVAAGVAGAAVAQDAPTEINFGIISTESQQNLRPKWEPFLADMAEKTGLEVKPFFASDYAGVIEGMRFGKVQLAWYGNKSAMEAVDRANGEVFVQTVSAEGNPGYWGTILVPADSPIQTVDELLTCDKSLNFGIGDVNSTSGYLVPMTFVFTARGIEPRDCFRNVTNANHETNLMAVANKQVDAAANNTESMALIEQNNPAAYAKLREIWRSPLIPADPIVWSKDLPQETKDKLREFFVTYGTDQSTGDVAHEREVLAGLEWAPFRPSSDAQLLPIRVMELQKSIGQLQADTSKPAAEKQAEIDRLTAEKTRFEDEIKANGQS